MSKARDLANAGTALGAVTATELGYVDGVTSAIQTQLDGKQAINANVSTTELGYLDGVTSAIQTQLDAKTAKSTLTTTGDIYYASGANTPARLGIGSSAQVLTVASGVPSWATPAAAGSWTLISEQSPSAVSSVNFTSIAATYKHLMLEWIGVTHSVTGDSFCVRINSDSGANYSTHYRNASGQISRDNAGTQISCSNGQGSTVASFGYGATTANFDQAAIGKVFFYDYYDTTKYKHMEWDSSYTATGISQYGSSGRSVWRSTSAITSINITRVSGTTATLSTTTGGYIRLWGSV